MNEAIVKRAEAQVFVSSQAATVCDPGLADGMTMEQPCEAGRVPPLAIAHAE